MKKSLWTKFIGFCDIISSLCEDRLARFVRFESGRRRRGAAIRHTPLLTVESLELRCVMSTLYAWGGSVTEGNMIMLTVWRDGDLRACEKIRLSVVVIASRGR